MRPIDALPHPADWCTTTVRRSVELTRGVSWSKGQEHSEPGPDRMPVIGIKNIQDRLELNDLVYLSGLRASDIEKARVSADWTVIVGSNGNRNRIGNAQLIRNNADFLFASFLIGAKPRSDSGLRPDYFFRWLCSEQVQSYLSASGEGTTGLSNLSHSFFRSMSIPVPPPEEQAGITRILDAVDTALERTREAAKRAQELKKALLDQFVYEALGETMYADRPRRELPKGWALVSTECLLAREPKNGISPSTSSRPPGVPTFSIGAIRDGRVHLHDKNHLKYAKLSDAETSSRFRLRRGDILLVRGNANSDLVGRAGVVDDFPRDCFYPDIAKRVIFATNCSPRILPKFAVLVWNHSTVHNQVLRRAKTSNGTLKINNRDVKQMVLPVPPENDQRRVASILGAMEEKRDALVVVGTSLEQLKKSLMHDLLTGKVRVGDATEVPAP